MKELLLALLLITATSTASAMPVKAKVFGYRLYAAYQLEYKKVKEDLNGNPLVGEWSMIGGRPANRLTSEYAYLGRCIYAATSNPEIGRCTYGAGYPKGFVKLVNSMMKNPAMWHLPTSED